MKTNSRRWNTVQMQILVWCGDEQLEIGHNGETFWVPPINEVAVVGRGKPYRLPAATTKAGVPIAGTVLVADVIEPNSDGGQVKLFDVGAMCRALELEQPELFKRGFNIVSDPDDCRAVQDEGRPLYEASLDARANEILDNEMARQKERVDQGRPVTRAGNEAQIIWAYKHKQGRASERPALSLEQITAAIAGTFAPPAAPTVERTTPGALSTAAIVEQAEEVGLNLTKADLTALLRGDEQVIPFIVQKIALKREEKAVETPA